MRTALEEVFGGTAIVKVLVITVSKVVEAERAVAGQSMVHVVNFELGNLLATEATSLYALVKLTDIS